MVLVEVRHIRACRLRGGGGTRWWRSQVRNCHQEGALREESCYEYAGEEEGVCEYLENFPTFGVEYFVLFVVGQPRYLTEHVPTTHAIDVVSTKKNDLLKMVNQIKESLFHQQKSNQ